MNLTTKQIKIMMQIVAGNGRDAQGNLIPVDLDELISRLDYQPTKQSIQFSIRALIKHQLIYKGQPEKRRGRIRVTLFPTDLGRTVVTGRPVASFVEELGAENSSADDDFFASGTPLEIIE